MLSTLRGYITDADLFSLSMDTKITKKFAKKRKIALIAMMSSAQEQGEAYSVEGRQGNVAKNQTQIVSRTCFFSSCQFL